MLNFEGDGPIDPSFSILPQNVETVTVLRPTEVEGVDETALLDRVDREGGRVLQVLLVALAKVLDLPLEGDAQP